MFTPAAPDTLTHDTTPRFDFADAEVVLDRFSGLATIHLADGRRLSGTAELPWSPDDAAGLWDGRVSVSGPSGISGETLTADEREAVDALIDARWDVERDGPARRVRERRTSDAIYRSMRLA